jgi:hypothetical protein
MDEWQKMTNYMMVGHHEGLWMSKVQILLFFSAFDCFLFTCRLYAFDGLLFMGAMLLI